jgi:hypothetical protein
MRALLRRSSPSSRLVLLLALGAAGCAALSPRGSKENNAAAGRTAEPDEEAAINRITGQMRDFGRALENKDFVSAAARLREAENGIKDATPVTRGHPDFEDLEQRVKIARPQLEEAIERDRIERRNAAIAALIKRGEKLIERGNILLTELAKRVPEADDMNELNELVGEFEAAERDGTGYLDDRLYKQHAETRDKLANLVIGRRRQAEWQIETSAAVGKTVAQAFDAVDEAKKAKKGEEQLTALRRAADALSACVNAIADAESLGGYDARSVLTTRMGTYAVKDTKTRCLEMSAKVRAEADRLAFRERVSGIANRVNNAMGAFTAATTAADKLTTGEAALEAFSACQAELEAAAHGPGYDASYKLSTHIGAGLDADKLRRACASERTKLARDLPAWRWRKSFESMKSGINTIKQHSDEASAAMPAAAQIQRWQHVVEELGSCAEKARSLAHDGDADPRYSIVTAFGNLSVAGVEKECERQRVVAEGKLARAVETQSIETFAQTCKADEVAVARREGVPTRVVPVEGGRLFLYGKGPGQKRFSFDAEGNAVDFAVKWRTEVEAVASEVGRAITAIKAAQTGAASLAATQAAFSALDVCVETLTGTERHPGFDGGRHFATVLGRVTASEFRTACAKKRTELAATVPTLKWRAQLEKIRDRAVEAYMQVEEARNDSDADKRVEASGVALGSYRECVERAEALARAPDADRKVTVNGPFGPVTALGLAKACKSEIANTQALLNAGLAARKLKQFLQSCKGDEVEVAKREGLPNRIERVGSGRVFIYERAGKKAKARRYAFDASGARVDEAVLKR